MRGAARCSTDGRGARDSCSPSQYIRSCYVRRLSPSLARSSSCRGFPFHPRCCTPKSGRRSVSVSRSVANRRRRWPLLRLLVPRDNSMPVVCSVGHGPRDLFLPSPDSCLLPGQVPTAAPPLRAISLYEESGLVERVGEEGRGSRPGPLR